jgi:hypothetical protein
VGTDRQADRIATRKAPTARKVITPSQMLATF